MDYTIFPKLYMNNHLASVPMTKYLLVMETDGLGLKEALLSQNATLICFYPGTGVSPFSTPV